MERESVHCASQRFIGRGRWVAHAIPVPATKPIKPSKPALLLSWPSSCVSPEQQNPRPSCLHYTTHLRFAAEHGNKPGPRGQGRLAAGSTYPRSTDRCMPGYSTWHNFGKGPANPHRQYPATEAGSEHRHRQVRYRARLMICLISRGCR